MYALEIFLSHKRNNEVERLKVERYLIFNVSGVLSNDRRVDIVNNEDEEGFLKFLLSCH